MRLGSVVLSALLLIPLSGCGPKATPVNSMAPTLSGDPVHPGQAVGWVDTQLYFGLGPADHPEQGTSEAAWRAFLDKEVTPRFPSGLSVVDVYGQWQGKKDPAPQRLRSKLLIVDYPDTGENRGKVEEIRSAWKQMTGQYSVLRITKPADVSF